VELEKSEIVFLARKGCPNSPAVYKSLLASLAGLDVSVEPVTLYLGELSKDDLRTGYGTPTILIDGDDLFGRSKPEPATPL